MPGGLVRSRGLDNGCQVTVCMSPSGVTRRLSVGPDAYLGIDVGLENSKTFMFPGLLEQDWSLSACLNLHNVSDFSSLVKAIPFYIFPIFILSLEEKYCPLSWVSLSGGCSAPEMDRPVCP